MSGSSKKSVVPGGVEEYIATCPEEIKATLKLIRATIREVAPDAIETVSYFGIPVIATKAMTTMVCLLGLATKNRTYGCMCDRRLQRIMLKSSLGAKSQRALLVFQKPAKYL